MKTSLRLFALGILTLATVCTTAHAADKLKALIVDGQNNHDWKSCQPVMKWILEDSGRFTVDVSSSPPSMSRGPQPPKAGSPQQKAAYDIAKAKWEQEKAAFELEKENLWKQWDPQFKKYDVIVSNYNGERWPASVAQAFVEYVRNGGGLVVVHAADNAFGDWAEYNEMIGVGGWGGRNEKSGPMLYWQDGKIVRDDSPGGGGTHGAQHEFVVETRVVDHPIMQGLPAKWKHAQDELYARLRGPAKDLTVLATAFSAPETRGTGKNEPILMVIDYGKGRVFHTVMGHGPQAMSGLGFQVTLARGAEWAATGKVTLPAPKPEDLPADKAAIRQPAAK